MTATTHAYESCKEEPARYNAGFNYCPVCTDSVLRHYDVLIVLITKLHSAKGRYHTQLAACDLFDAVGLKNERPVK